MKTYLFVFTITFLVSVGSVSAGNVALHKPAWATAEIHGPASAAVDGIYGTGSNNWNSGVLGTVNNPVVLGIDLEDIYLVNRINLYADNRYIEGNYESYNLLSSIDQSSWTLINSGDLIGTSNPWPEQLNFDPISMRYLRFEVTGGTLWGHLYEMEVYDVPEPATLLLFGFGAAMLRRKQQNRLTVTGKKV